MKEVDVEIKVKGSDGTVISYTEDPSESSSSKVSKKSKIQSEDTLEMLKNVLKPGTAKEGGRKTKKQTSTFKSENTETDSK
jgi:hypothetical protein